jgi:hypothetical protein
MLRIFQRFVDWFGGRIEIDIHFYFARNRLGQSKANEAMRRQIEAHGKKLDIMREQHDEVL